MHNTKHWSWKVALKMCNIKNDPPFCANLSSYDPLIEQTVQFLVKILSLAHFGGLVCELRFQSLTDSSAVLCVIAAVREGWLKRGFLDALYICHSFLWRWGPWHPDLCWSLSCIVFTTRSNSASLVYGMCRVYAGVSHTRTYMHIGSKWCDIILPQNIIRQHWQILFIYSYKTAYHYQCLARSKEVPLQTYSFITFCWLIGFAG